MVSADTRLKIARRVLLTVAVCCATIVLLITVRWTPVDWLSPQGSFGGDRDGAFFWQRMLNVGGHGASAVAEEEADRIVFVSWGVDHHSFVTVDRAEAEAAYPQAVADRIEQLIGWMEKDPRHDTPPYSLSLRSLTGEDLGDDPAAWRTWWEANKASFIPDADARQRLIDAAITWERSQRGVSWTEQRLRAAPAMYRNAVRAWWLRRVLLMVAALAYVGYVLLGLSGTRRRQGEAASG